MIKLEGIVLNVFTQQGGKDKKTGDQFADRDKVQILGAMDLPNGDVKNELFTLSVENYISSPLSPRRKGIFVETEGNKND